MNNIYIFGITSAKGGIESLMRHLVLDIAKKYKENKVHIATSYKSIAFADEYKNLGVDIVRIPQRTEKKAYVSSISKILSSLDEGDVVYLNLSTYCNGSLLNVVKTTKAKVIIHGHNSYVSNPLKKVLHFIGKLRFKNIGYKIAVSEECDKFMFNNTANFIGYNGIETKRFEFDLDSRNKIRHQLNLDERNLIVGCVGRISEEKNQLFLAKMAKKYPDIKFLFVGGVMSNKYGKKVKSISPNNTIFVGEQSDIRGYMSAMDCLVLPSVHEGFPIVAIEGLTNGLTVFYNERLFKKLSPSIKMNHKSQPFDCENFTINLIKELNKARNENRVSCDNNFDIRILLDQLEKVIYAK